MESSANITALQMLSRKIDIPLWRFKKALGIPLEPCNASTIEEAEREYDMSVKGSEAEQAALNKWIQLSLVAIKQASTMREVKEAYNDAPSDSEAEQAALARWNELSLKAVEEASTIEEVERAHDNAPHDSEARQAALLKIYELYTHSD